MLELCFACLKCFRNFFIILCLLNHIEMLNNHKKREWGVVLSAFSSYICANLKTKKNEIHTHFLERNVKSYVWILWLEKFRVQSYVMGLKLLFVKAPF